MRDAQRDYSRWLNIRLHRRGHSWANRDSLVVWTPCLRHANSGQIPIRCEGVVSLAGSI
jgi:hypothetical protein